MHEAWDNLRVSWPRVVPLVRALALPIVKASLAPLNSAQPIYVHARAHADSNSDSDDTREWDCLLAPISLPARGRRGSRLLAAVEVRASAREGVGPTGSCR